MKLKILVLLQLSVCFVTFLPVSNTYTVTGNEIRDLESTTQANFATEASAWTASSLVTPGVIYSNCSGVFLLGGYNIFKSNQYLERYYSNVPAHDMIKFSVVIWYIDSWDAVDHWEITFNSVTLDIAFNMAHGSVFPNTNLCGSTGYSDLPGVVIEGKVFDAATDLDLKFTSRTNENATNESFGIRELLLIFLYKNSTDVQGFCGDATVNLPQLSCCSASQYTEYNPGQCANCDPACSSCFWGTSSDCLKCNTGYYLSGTQCLPCNSLCSKCTGPTADQCSVCTTNNYLVLGQSCIASCTSPMIPSGSNPNLVCSYPCSSSQYIYPNITCHSSCGQYLRPAIKSGQKFCDYYCSSTKYYVAATESCVTSCPEGYYQDTNYMYCIPCQDSLCASCPLQSGAQCSVCKSGSILSDGVCKACQAMNVEYIKSTLTGDRFEITFTPSTCILDPEFVMANLVATDASKSKFPTFTFTFQQIDTYLYYLDISFASSVLNPDNMNLQLSYLTGVAPITKMYTGSAALQNLAAAAPTVSTAIGGSLGAGFAGAIAMGTTAALWSLVGFQQFVGYFIYINIDYPLQVEVFLSLLQSTTFSFLPNPLASATNYLEEGYGGFSANLTATQYLPPKKFVDQDQNSFFIENGGSTMGIGFGILFTILIIPPLLRIRVLPGRSYLYKIQQGLKWNVTARTFLESGIPLSLAIFLQCRKLSFQTLYLRFSVICTFLSIIYYVFMLNYLIKKLQSTGNYFLETQKVRNVYGTLYEGIKLKVGYGKYYHLFILFRGILLMFLIAFLEDVPILQVIPLIFYNAWLIYYLFKEAQFEDPKLNIINRMKEILILIGEVSIMCLTFKGGSEEYYQTLGWITVSALGSALLIDLSYTFILQFVKMRQLPKQIRQWYRLTKKVVNKSSAKEKRKKMITMQSTHLDHHF